MALFFYTFLEQSALSVPKCKKACLTGVTDFDRYPKKISCDRNVTGFVTVFVTVFSYKSLKSSTISEALKRT